MAKNDQGSLSGRTELVDALDNLRNAMGQLVRAAESRRSPRHTRQVHPESPGLNLSVVHEAPAEPGSALNSCASLVPVLEAEDDAVAPPEASATLSRSAGNEGERAFASRLVLLQGRLGGFLK